MSELEQLAFNPDEDDDEGSDAAGPATGATGAPGEAGAPPKNYITQAGEARLRAELLQLIDVERPQVVDAVYWAAKNGDRSENGDYIYGKKRLREIDRRLRFLTKRLAIAQVVDTAINQGVEQVFFGAHVTYSQADGQQHTVQIVGVDEVQHERGQISWVSPMAKALLRAYVGDEVRVQTPSGVQAVVIEDVRYG
jgi:transcription elongation factor GreB